MVKRTLGVSAPPTPPAPSRPVVKQKFTKKDFKQEWDEMKDRHRLVNKITGDKTTWCGYVGWAYLDGFVSHTAYYGTKEGVLSAAEFCKLAAMAR